MSADTPDTTSHRTSRVRLGVAIILVAIASLLLAGIVPRWLETRRLEADALARESGAPSVLTVIAKDAPPVAEIELPGTISGLTEAPLLARSDGYVKQRFVDIGDRVKAGQLLATIDSPDLDRQVDEARAAVLQAESMLAQAESALIQAQANEKLAAVTAQRWTRLRERGAVSRQDYDTNNTNYEAQAAGVRVATANVAAANYALKASRANLRRYLELQGYEQVRAPFDGLITLRNIDVGALINTGSTLLFRVADAHIVRLFINVPETDSATIRVGQDATLTTGTYGPRTFTGKVTRTADALDPAARTMLTEVQVQNPDLALRPGMYATVRLKAPRAQRVVLVPSDCLILRSVGPQVAVVTKDDRIQFRKVEIGRDFGNQLEVLSGLRAGERVVSSPNDSAVEGARVEVR